MMVFKSSESPGLPPSTTLITSCPCPRTTPEQTDSKVYSSVKKVFCADCLKHCIKRTKYSKGTLKSHPQLRPLNYIVYS